jgi:hypothetical protein
MPCPSNTARSEGALPGQQPARVGASVAGLGIPACTKAGAGSAHAISLGSVKPLSGEKRGIRRRLKQKQPGDVLLFTDWTLLRLFPPLRAAWSRVGEPALVPVTGQNAKHVLFGAVHVHTGPRVVLCRRSAGGADARTFLSELRRRYRPAPTSLAAVGPGTRSHRYENAATGGRTRYRAGVVAQAMARTKRHGPLGEGVEEADGCESPNGEYR